MTGLRDSFALSLAGALAEAMANDFDDNYDSRRFGPLSPSKKILDPREFAKRLLLRCGLVTASSARAAIRTGGNLVAPHLDGLETLYRRLNDQESRDVLVNVMAYRALGHRRVRLPLSQPEYERTLSRIEAMAVGAECVDVGFMEWQAHKLDLSSFGYPVRLFVRPTGVFTQFIAQQYRCVTTDGIIEAEPGDIVIDGGGCYGDTALYFAHKAGAQGEVYSFEFLPENLAIFRRNMALNPELSERINLVENPLWSSSGAPLFVEPDGPGTHVVESSDDPDAQRVLTLTIDDLARDHGLKSVDFIKMDIEGAELPALKGAEQTLRRFRPKLGISVYHRLEDFVAIFQYLDALGLGYRFYLRHFTIHAEETILFAVQGEDVK